MMSINWAIHDCFNIKWHVPYYCQPVNELQETHTYWSTGIFKPQEVFLVSDTFLLEEPMVYYVTNSYIYINIFLGFYDFQRIDFILQYSAIDYFSWTIFIWMKGKIMGFHYYFEFWCSDALRDSFTFRTIVLYGCYLFYWLIFSNYCS